MIRMEDVSFSYQTTNKVDVLRNINLVVEEGEFVLLTGVSGSGKTSMTKLINGLIPEFEQGNLRGDIIVNGQNTKEVYVSDLSHHVGSVFQDPNAQFFTTDAISELVFPCENVGMERAEIDKRLTAIRAQMQLDALLEREIFTLSGGEKQRIAIASVCMYHPKVLVLDEPSANLDGAAIRTLARVLRNLKDEGYTIVISEHRIHYLMTLCDKVVYMKEGSIAATYQGDEFRALSNDALHTLGLRAGNLALLPNPAAVCTAAGAAEQISIKQITYGYGDGRKVLQDISMTFAKGDIVGIIGENGAGKSTLMEIVCGLRRENAGSIYLNGTFTRLKDRQAKTSFVMQVPEYQLFTESVQAEIDLTGADAALCADLLEKLHLDDLLERHPASLSGGQKQRLCILLAAIKDASIICFDEPTSGLDYGNMQEVMGILQGLASQGKTVLVVTHDYEFIMNCCNKVIFMTQQKAYKTLDVNEMNQPRIAAYMEESTVHKENTSKQTPMQMLWRFVKPSAGKEIIAVLFAVLSVLGAMVPYVATYQIFQLFFAGTQTEQNVAHWCLVAMAGFVVKAAGHAISTNIAHICAYDILKNMRLYMGEKLMKTSLGATQNKSIGRLKNLIVDQVETLELQLAHVIPEGTAAVVLPVVIFAYMCTLDYRLALASFITLPLAFFPFIFIFKSYGTNYDHYMKSNDYMNSTIVEYVEGIEVVKAFGQTDSSYGKFTKAVQEFKNSTMEWFRTTRLSLSIVAVVLPTTTLAVVPLGIYFYLSEGVSPALILTSVLLSMGMVGNFSKLAMFMNDVKAVQYAMQTVSEEMQDDEMTQGDQDSAVQHYNIAFKGVVFTYSDSLGDAVIKNMNIALDEGHFYALVGPSGSGKSTMAKLLARFWDVSQGQITIGGVNIQDISLKKLGEMVSFVTQDNFLFNVSIFENIKVGNPNATDEAVYLAAKRAMCDEFIGKLEHGYQSTAGEAGAKLSGGERQRITIARAILKDAPIVILDEATAFTDPQNEMQIQKSIRALTKDKTLIVIAHRLSTIQHADKIFVMQAGEIEAQGTHAELLQHSKLYQTMWEMHVNAKEWGVTNV